MALLERCSVYVFVIIMVSITKSQQDELQIIVQPQDAIVKAGAKVRLECKFNLAVSKCTWFTEGLNKVQLNDYNAYDDKSKNGTNTTDCNLIIGNFQVYVDAGCYYCVGIGENSSKPAIASNKACLSLDIPDNYTPEASTIISSPQIVNGSKDASVNLPCSFNRSVLSCGWRRNDRSNYQRIYGRYELITFGRSRNNNGDCSIRINQLQDSDAVYWSCHAQVSQGDAFEIIGSNWMKLNVYGEHIKDLVYGNTKDYTCVFLIPVLLVVIITIVTISVIAVWLQLKEKGNEKSRRVSITIDQPGNTPEQELQNCSTLSTQNTDDGGYMQPNTHKIFPTKLFNEPIYHHYDVVAE